MKLEWKDIRNNTTSEEYAHLIGIIHGYTKESRDYFIKKIKGLNKVDPKIIDYYKASGLLGTGYISNPRELRALNSGKITKDDIIKGINERRALKKSFLKNSDSSNKSKARLMYEVAMWRLRGKVPRPLDFDIDKVPSPYKEKLIEIYLKVNKK